MATNNMRTRWLLVAIVMCVAMVPSQAMRLSTLRSQTKAGSTALTQTTLRNQQDEGLVATLLVSMVVSGLMGASSTAAQNKANQITRTANLQVNEIQNAARAEFSEVDANFDAAMGALQKAANELVDHTLLALKRSQSKPMQKLLTFIVLIKYPEYALTEAEAHTPHTVAGKMVDVAEAFVLSAAHKGINEVVGKALNPKIAGMLANFLLPGIGQVYNKKYLFKSLYAISKAADRKRRVVANFKYARRYAAHSHVYFCCRKAHDMLQLWSQIYASWQKYVKRARSPKIKLLIPLMDTAYEKAKALDKFHPKCEAFQSREALKKMPKCLRKASDDELVCCPAIGFWYCNHINQHKCASGNGVNRDEVFSLKLRRHKLYLHVPPCTAKSYLSRPYVSDIKQITRRTPLKSAKSLFSNGPFGSRPFAPIPYGLDKFRQLTDLKQRNLPETASQIPRLLGFKNEGVDYEDNFFASDKYIYLQRSMFPGPPIVTIATKKHSDYFRKVVDLDGASQRSPYLYFGYQPFIKPVTLGIQKQWSKAELEVIEQAYQRIKKNKFKALKYKKD